MRKKLVYAGLLVGLLVALGWRQVVSQPNKVYESWVDTPEYLAAGKQTETDIPKARQDFIAIADQHPNTTLGAMSLLSAASMPSGTASGVVIEPPTSDHPAVIDDEAQCIAEATAVYQRTIDQYPNSRYAMMAQARIYEINRTDYAQYVQNLEGLLASKGCPSVRDLIRDRQGSIDALQAVPTEIRLGALNVYEALAAGYSFLSGRDAEVWALGLLGEQFRLQCSYPREILFSKNNISWQDDPPRLNPVVRLLQPEDEGGSRPKFLVEITDGNYKQPQIDIPKVKFLIDGQDVSSRLQIKIKVQRQLKENQIFETIRVKYRPAVELASGQHNLTVYAPTGGYPGTGPGATTASWRFRVRRERCDDDDRDWGRDDDRDFE